MDFNKPNKIKHFQVCTHILLQHNFPDIDEQIFFYFSLYLFML